MPSFYGLPGRNELEMGAERIPNQPYMLKIHQIIVKVASFWDIAPDYLV
jgi:hypothetical protein